MTDPQTQVELWSLDPTYGQPVWNGGGEAPYSFREANSPCSDGDEEVPANEWIVERDEDGHLMAVCYSEDDAAQITAMLCRALGPQPGHDLLDEGPT